MNDFLDQLFQLAKPLFIAITLIPAVQADSIGSGAAFETSPAEATGRLIIKYRSASHPWQSPRGSVRFTRSHWRAQKQLDLARSLSNHSELVVTDQADINGLRSQAKMISEDAAVEYASVEYRRFPMLQPNDPLYNGSDEPGNQAYLYDGIYSLNAPAAWDITTGSSSSVIAIVDTGVLPQHPAIADRSVPGLGYDFVSADSPGDFTSANDGNGRDENPVDPGDPCNNDPSTWHGTAVASVAAGNSNDAEGATGVDWNARLLHARALGQCGGTDADIIDAIRWSAGLPVPGTPDNQNPANVVNLSLGGATECTRAWQDVIDELAALNVVFVMAAGNEGVNALRSAPANCANVITVGSSTTAGNVDGGFSNYGLKVTISTGGRNIIAASNRGYEREDQNGDYYRTETGTSFSAALVSGAISLMHSINPDLGPSGVRALLHESATAYATGTNCEFYYCGPGILDLSRAMTMLRDGSFNQDRNRALELIQNNAGTLALQQETNSSLVGYKDIRYFTITVPERGLIKAQSTSENDLYGYLLNAQLSVIAMDDDSGDSTNFKVAAVVDPGTYYLAVERQSHRLSDQEQPFTVTTTLSDDAPSPFTFTPSTDVTANAVAESETVQIDGLGTDSIVTVSDGYYRLNGGQLTITPSTIRNGDTLQLAVQSPAAIDRTNTATVTVGAYSTTFSATTGNTNPILAGGRINPGAGCMISGSASIDPLMLFSLMLALGGVMRKRREPATIAD